MRATHDAIALVTGLDELCITADEAKALSNSLTEMQKQFPDFRLSPKLLAIIGLVSTAAIIYIPRGISVVKRIKTKREKRMEQAKQEERDKQNYPDVVTK